MKTVTFDESKWALVPLAPTPTMLLAAGYRASAVGASTTGHEAWAAFLSAAPQPPAVKEAEQKDATATAKREKEQREKLAKQLEGRKPAPVRVEDYGSPALKEDALEIPRPNSRSSYDALTPDRRKKLDHDMLVLDQQIQDRNRSRERRTHDEPHEGERRMADRRHHD